MTMSAEQPFQLASQALGALPILGQFLDRLGLEQVLERHLPDDDPRVLLAAARTIKVLVLNLCVEREPLYGIGEWARRFEAGALSLEPGEVALLCDDRVGRALDRLFDADRASLLTELTLRAISEFGVDCSQLHNDSTSITLHGEYLQADGRERGGQSTAAAKRGHNKEHRGDLKQWISTQAPDWVEACRRPGKRNGDPDLVWRVCPAPFPTTEGYRITWVHSSAKQHHDESARAERIDRARHALGELSERLAGPRARITTRVAAEEAAAALLSASGGERWVSVTVTETVEERYRQEKRGRPGNDTRYRKIAKTRYTLEVSVDAEQVRYDAASDGCFPLTSNDSELTDTQVLAAYRL
jgi:hypothetical protein